MNSSDRNELEQMALSAELAGQLGHDFGAFVHHLSLQMDLAQATPDRQPDWPALKREGKQLIELLREWERFRGSPPPPAAIDLNELLRGLVRRIRRQGSRSRITTSLARAPIRLMSLSGELRRLCQLLLLHAVSADRSAGANGSALSVRTRAEKDKALLQIRDVPSCDPSFLDEATASPSLLIKTCRSLSLRLDANLRANRQADGKVTIVVELPKQL